MLLVFCAESVVSQVWADPPRSTHYDGTAEECHILTGFITGSQAKGNPKATRAVEAAYAQKIQPIVVLL
jgi:uncharacterized cupin superfamily protein